MFIKSLKIENFKGYHGPDNNLEFNIPDGSTEGSGLNVFVGENNSGKSTIFEVMDFIKDGTKKNIEDLLSKLVPDSIPEYLSAEIVFTGNLSEVIAAHIQGNKVASFNSHVYEDGGFQYFRVKRSSEVGDKKYCSGMVLLLLIRAELMHHSRNFMIITLFGRTQTQLVRQSSVQPQFVGLFLKRLRLDMRIRKSIEGSGICFSMYSTTLTQN